MSEERNWGAEPWRAPDLDKDDVLLFSECGRIIKAGTYGHGANGIDYRSHYFSVVKGAHGYGCYLLVKHGGGQERFKIDYSPERAVLFFTLLDSNARYLLMHMLFSVAKDSAKIAADDAAAKWRAAFVNGTLKKRKVRGSDSVKVWIDHSVRAH